METEKKKPFFNSEMAPKDKLRLMEDAKQRRQSTDTLQRLSLVAFELENHLKIMRRSNSRGPQKYIFTIRFVNTVREEGIRRQILIRAAKNTPIGDNFYT